jgi:hypothetical protein
MGGALEEMLSAAETEKVERMAAVSWRGLRQRREILMDFMAESIFQLIGEPQ